MAYFERRCHPRLARRLHYKSRSVGTYRKSLDRYIFATNPPRLDHRHHVDPRTQSAALGISRYRQRYFSACAVQHPRLLRLLHYRSPTDQSDSSPTRLLWRPQLSTK